MANPTPQQTAQLEEQQKKFNDELNRTESLLESIGDSLSDRIKTALKSSISNANALNVEFGTGVDISKKLATEQLKLSAKIETAERARSRARKASDIDSLTYQIKIYERLQKQLYKTGEILDEEIKNSKEKQKKYQEENSLLARANILGSIFGKIGLANLITFESLLKAVFQVDNEITQMGKSLGISHQMASDLRDSMVSYVRASTDGFINTNKLAAAQAALTEQLGFAVDFGNEEREIFARLTEITGLTADEAGKLAKFSAATGATTTKYVSDLRVAANESMRANKIHISDKELLSSVSKLSAGILVKFQGNPKAIADAVVQAKKLGTSLEQIDKIGESLLNWESSIENELQAELITGRKLNFEKARSAALTGDQAELMQEMVSQAGSLVNFQNMNVIAQQSLAQAFGMSRDEMADMLMKQEAITKYGDAAAKLNKEQLEDMQRRNMSAAEYLDMVENQRSTQERFNDLLTKMQDAFANIAAGPLGTIMSMFASIAENAGVMYTLILAAAGIMAVNMAASLGKTISQLEVIVGLRTAEAAAAVTTAQAMSLGFAAIGIIAGLSLVMGALSSAKKGNDVISSGYGKRMILGPEGAVSLNDNDTIIAGTNLGGGGGGSNAGVMSAINNLAASIKNQPAPQFALNVNGEKLGQVTGRQQSTGTEQFKNSYRLA
jgi:hypothetical protein